MSHCGDWDPRGGEVGKRGRSTLFRECHVAGIIVAVVGAGEGGSDCLSAAAVVSKQRFWQQPQIMEQRVSSVRVDAEDHDIGPK